MTERENAWRQQNEESAETSATMVGGQGRRIGGESSAGAGWWSEVGLKMEGLMNDATRGSQGASARKETAQEEEKGEAPYNAVSKEKGSDDSGR